MLNMARTAIIHDCSKVWSNFGPNINDNNNNNDNSNNNKIIILIINNSLSK